MLNSYFGVFTHWILREFDISFYLTECYDNFINFKWEIPDLQDYTCFSVRFYSVAGSTADPDLEQVV